MTESPVPQPTTVNDFLVKAVHDRLVEQNDLLRQLLDRTVPPPVEEPVAELEPLPQPVLITEPAPSKRPPLRKQQQLGRR